MGVVVLTPSSPEAQPLAAAPPQTVPTAQPGEMLAFVMPVSGAPGDGRESLTVALGERLVAGGVKLASAPADNVYTVKGSVSLDYASWGRQSIRVDWQVLDPDGKRLGTVSQQNIIPNGSLNGAWGAIADAVAGAAADGIIKLLPAPLAPSPAPAPSQEPPMTFVVQVGSKQTPAEALATFADMQQKYLPLIAGYRPMLQKADLGAYGVWYRLRIGPIPDKETATRLCGQLKSQGHPDCLVMATQ